MHLGNSASIAASFDFSRSNVRSRYLVKYTQAYYTVDIDAPGRPSDFFADGVTVEDVGAIIDAENPPLYVASVTYGRMVVFTFESEYSGEELPRPPPRLGSSLCRDRLEGAAPRSLASLTLAACPLAGGSR